MNLPDFVARLRALPAKIEEAETLALTAAAEAVAEEARDEIGRYQSDPYAWPLLAESTVQDKTRRGYSPPDNPLLRTGDMRDSIDKTVVGRVATIGSTDPVAVFQELGTEKIPPRPFLKRALFTLAPRLAAEIGREIAEVVGGK